MSQENHEHWIAVKIPEHPCFDGLYSVSNHGRVRRDSAGVNTYSGRILNPSKDYEGYRVVPFCNGSNRKLFKVHRLVAKAFISNPENKSQVNHINGIVGDNRVENLEWNTASENNKHAIDKLGRKTMKGELQGSSVLKESDVIQIRSWWKTGDVTQKSLARVFGVGPTQIWKIIKREQWTHI